MPETEQSVNWAQGFKPSKKLALVGLAGLTLVFLASLLLRPAVTPSGQYFTLCGFKNFTGLPCPACGMTHSFCAMAKGDVLGALAFNLMGPPLFLILVLLWIRSASVLMNWPSPVRILDEGANRLKLARSFVITLAVFGLARIAYVLVFQTASVQTSPLARLVARIFG